MRRKELVWAGKVALLIVIAVILQILVISRISVLGVTADLFLVLTVLVGLGAGALQGALFGFFAGVVHDTIFFQPLGVHALIFVLVGYFAGMAAAFAGVAGGFGVNVLITPTDAILTEITNEAIGLVDPARSIDITANFYFAIASSLVLTILLAIITTRVVEKRLGAYDPSVAPSDEEIGRAHV